MRSNEERIAEVKRRIAEKEYKKRLRREWAAAVCCVAACLAVLLELGENYKDPSLIRWPFEKTAMLNNKAYLFRVHKIFSQVPEELSGKSCPVAEV